MPELTSITDLKPAPYNPRMITRDNARALGHSLREFGDISGIVWNKRTGFLVAGHQRLDTLKAQHGVGTLDFEVLSEEAAIIRTPDGNTFDVRIVDWDEHKERAANLAANSPTLAGEFTTDVEALLTAVQHHQPELSADLRLDELMAAISAAGTPASTTSRAPDSAAEPSMGGVQYQVVVTARDEQEQGRIVEEMEARGLTCRMLTL